jgi:glycosyltransferase involved in cell wall biosynthesis
VPTFNEAGKVGRVLTVLKEVECLGEIIVVDDGSTDGTLQEITDLAEEDRRIRILCHVKNLGKGEAIFSGWRASHADYLVLLDADLFGLKPAHIQDLMRPVLEGKADMTIGQFKQGTWRSDISHFLTPWLSGQRCLRSELLAQVSRQAASGYGFETALTVAARQNGWHCLRVPMRGVWHIPSESRRGLLPGLRTRSRMYGQIIYAWYLAGGFRRLGLSPRVR